MNALFSMLSLGLALSLSACGLDGPAGTEALPGAVVNAASEAAPASSIPTLPYQFDQPVAAFELPEDLREISGLTLLGDGRLGAVQDEDGELYVLDQETGEVTDVVAFGPAGDYEGIELVGDRLFVLRADGVLLELAGWEGGSSDARPTEAGLPAGCDAEGLGFESARSRLLIACKENGGEGLGEHKAIYALGLDSGAFDPAPAYVLDPSTLPGERNVKPSALAVHPLTGHIVVLSSVRQVLVAFAPDGAVAASWDLGPAAFEQPEGIAFLPNGDLFIASEGSDGPPLLKRFAYQDSP